MRIEGKKKMGWGGGVYTGTSEFPTFSEANTKPLVDAPPRIYPPCLPDDSQHDEQHLKAGVSAGPFNGQVRNVLLLQPKPLSRSERRAADPVKVLGDEQKSAPPGPMMKEAAAFKWMLGDSETARVPSSLLLPTSSLLPAHQFRPRREVASATAVEFPNYPRVPQGLASELQDLCDFGGF